MLCRAFHVSNGEFLTEILIPKFQHKKPFSEPFPKLWERKVILTDIFDYFLMNPRPQSSFDILYFSNLKNKRIWLNVKVRWSRESTQIFFIFHWKNDWFLIATSISIAFKSILSLKSTKNDYFAFSKTEIFGQVKCIDHQPSTMTAWMT